MTYGIFFLAALAEIAGCFTFWMWLKLDRSAWWLVPGVLLLALFAALLMRTDAQFAGRAFAAYGGIYIASSVAWLALIENQKPLMTDIVGAAICIAGAIVILTGPRGSAFIGS